MAQKKNLASSHGDPVATVIGDVVGSRDARRPTRPARPAGRAGWPSSTSCSGPRNAPAGSRWSCRRPGSPLGDEYQGTFTTLGVALRATRWLRLSLLPDVDVRHGIGWGPVQVLEDEPRVEDGPGWWAAREAVESVEEAALRPGHRRRRTAYVRVDGCRRGRTRRP